MARQVIGWLTVLLATAATAFAGFWGIVENFHEGWHHPALWGRLVGTAAYLTPMLILMALSLVALRWRWAGLALCAGFAALALWFFRASPAAVLMLAAPACVLGIGFLAGRPEPRTWASRLMIVVPWATVILAGVEPAWRVATRVDDGDRGARRVTANSVDLVWAPQGPGWPKQGMSWHEATERCRYLTADGASLATTLQDIWRLPTVEEEVVRSQCRHGENCGGAWDAKSGRATYRRAPDKEPPLWDPYTQIVYWWTATEVDHDTAYFVSFNGYVRPRPKNIGYGYQGFRAVKAPSPGS